MRRANLLVALVVSGAFGLSACSEPTTGNPTTKAGASTETGTQQPGKTTTTKKTSENSPLKDVDPCELISASAAQALGITGAPKKADVGSTRGCDWRVQKGSVSESYTIGVSVLESRGIKDVVSSGEKKPLTVGGHEAVQWFGSGGNGCGIALAVSEKSRVDVAVVGGEATKLCAPALEAAKLVEPELP